jgi:membrane protein insertase Oxa1/YidC/SpoIIIJ
MWPLTGAQVGSAKRMSGIQKQMQEIREKYKNNPQKL